MRVQHTVCILAAGIVSSTLTGFAVRTASAQVLDRDGHKLAVTAVGCLQREKDYRHDNSRGSGLLGGKGDEFVLINASIGSPSMPIAPVSEEESTNCLASGSNGQAFELTGKQEDHLGELIGRRVVIVGMLKHAKHDPEAIGTSGTFTPAPTKGGPLPGDLNLREINVESFSIAPVAARPVARRSEAPPAIAEPLPAPAPEVAEPTPQPEQTVAAELPKTASPLPLIGLIGLLSLFGAVALHRYGRA